MRGYKLTSQKKIQMLILTQTHMQKRVFFLDFYIKKSYYYYYYFFCEQAAKELIFTCSHGGRAATKAFSNLARPRASFSIRPQFSANALMTMSARTASVTETPSATFTSLSRTTWRRLTLCEQKTRHGPHVLTSLSVATASVKGPCATISLSMVCVHNISLILCFYAPKNDVNTAH